MAAGQWRRSTAWPLVFRSTTWAQRGRHAPQSRRHHRRGIGCGACAVGAAVATFAGGLYLPDNQRTCRPAKLSQVAGVAGEGADRTYLVTLCEGKRHQVKCMVNAVSGGANRVVALHRSRVGGLVLDEAALPAGAWRLLTEEEVRRLDGAPFAAEERRGGTAAGAA